MKFKSLLQLTPLQASTYSLSAITLALAELPRTLTAAGVKGPSEAGDQASPEHSLLLEHAKLAMRQLALHVGDLSQLCHALGGVLRQHTSAVLMPVVAPQPQSTLLFVLDLCLSAVKSIHEFKVQVQPKKLLFCYRSVPTGENIGLGEIGLAGHS